MLNFCKNGLLFFYQIKVPFTAVQTNTSRRIRKQKYLTDQRFQNLIWKTEKNKGLC